MTRMYAPAGGLAAPKGTAADVLKERSGTVYAIGPRQTVYEAVERMKDYQVGALVVLDGERLAGILSERDYARKVILLGRASRETRVEEIMTAKVITVGPDASLAQCMQLVTQYKIRHLPVLEGERVIGVLSTGDLVRALLEQQAETIQSLSSYIGSDYPT